MPLKYIYYQNIYDAEYMENKWKQHASITTAGRRHAKIEVGKKTARNV